MLSIFKSGHKRIIFVALLAAFTFVGAAIFLFDVDKKELFEFFVVSVFGLGLIILAALLLTALRLLLRRFF